MSVESFSTLDADPSAVAAVNAAAATGRCLCDTEAKGERGSLEWIEDHLRRYGRNNSFLNVHISSVAWSEETRKFNITAYHWARCAELNRDVYSRCQCVKSVWGIVRTVWCLLPYEDSLELSVVEPEDEAVYIQCRENE